MPARKRPEGATKQQSQRIHAMRRALERFEVSLTRAQYNLLVDQIQQKQAEMVLTISNRLTIYRLALDGREAHALYDKRRHTIVTFLLPEWTQQDLLEET